MVRVPQYRQVSISVFPDTAGREALEESIWKRRRDVVSHLVSTHFVPSSLPLRGYVRLPLWAVVFVRLFCCALSGDELCSLAKRDPLWLRGCLSGAMKPCLLCPHEGEHISLHTLKQTAVVHLSSAPP